MAARPVSLRLSEELVGALDEAAKVGRSTRTALVERACRAHLGMPQPGAQAPPADRPYRCPVHDCDRGFGSDKAVCPVHGRRAVPA